MEECFVGEPTVHKIAVHRDEPDAQNGPDNEVKDLTEELLDGNEHIQGINTVDKTQRDGTVIYDTIFRARVPGNDAIIGLIINVEFCISESEKPQKDCFKPDVFEKLYVQNIIRDGKNLPLFF